MVDHRTGAVVAVNHVAEARPLEADPSEAPDKKLAVEDITVVSLTNHNISQSPTFIMHIISFLFSSENTSVTISPKYSLLFAYNKLLIPTLDDHLLAPPPEFQVHGPWQNEFDNLRNCYGDDRFSFTS